MSLASGLFDDDTATNDAKLIFRKASVVLFLLTAGSAMWWLL